MTNGERIRSMTDEELAKYITCCNCSNNDECDNCFGVNDSYCMDMYEIELDHLKSEV